MPQVGFGTFLLHGEDCKNAVREAVTAGYRMIDTAEAYGNEKAVGDGIKESGIDREELFLVTKVNFKSYEHTRETVKNSLRLLGTDYLDLVLLHWPFANYYAAWRNLEPLYEEGIIRAIGVSNFEPDRLIDLDCLQQGKACGEPNRNTSVLSANRGARVGGEIRRCSHGVCTSRTRTHE